MGNQSSELNEIWSLIKETRKDIKETQKNIKDLSISQKETDRQMKAGQKETDRQMKATFIDLSASQKELQASQREMSKEIQRAQNLFTTQWGRLMESLVEGDLVRLLQERGVKIERTSTNEKGLMSYVDEAGIKQQERCEIDIVAKNGQEIVVVEVKTTLTVKDARKFLDVLKRFPRLFPEYRDKKIYGAVAYLRTQDSSDIYSEKQGLFIIKATGSSASITNQEGFKPKLFS